MHKQYTLTNTYTLKDNIDCVYKVYIHTVNCTYSMYTQNCVYMHMVNCTVCTLRDNTKVCLQ